MDPWFRVNVQHLALITHQIPAGPVREKIPAGYELETVDVGGEERCFISAACFRNTGFRWALAPFPRFYFDQLNFRTYVRHKGRAGVYFFASVLSSPLAAAAEWLAIRNSHVGKFQISHELGPHGYSRYFSAVESALGLTYFELRAHDFPKAAAPFTTGTALSDFFTHRLHGFAEAPGGFQVDQVVRHAKMNPWSGTLLIGRFEFWERLGFLSPQNADRPYSVLIEPQVRMTVVPAVPAQWIGVGATPERRHIRETVPPPISLLKRRPEDVARQDKARVKRPVSSRSR